MEASHQLILAGAALVAFSILLAQLSTRFGAPLLLVFLAIGMLAGEDGPGGILFSDYSSAFVIGSLALAVILFDGGLRTSRDTLRLALGPAAVLFYTHQHIAFGGLLGEYYLMGLGPYLRTAAVHWATVTVYLLLWAGVWRGAGEVVAWAAAALAPSLVPPR